MLLYAIIAYIFVWKVNADVSLWDHVVKMEQVVLTVEYNGRHLKVWRDDNHGYSRFYVTPLCVLDQASIECVKDEFSDQHRYIYSFNLKLWDSLAAQAVQLALKQKNIDSKASDILPLPMQMVRLGLSSHITSKIQVDDQWRSHQDQPNVMMFELYTKHRHFCDKMVNESKLNLPFFLARTKLFFEFSMVVQQQASRALNVSGKTIAKSSFFSNLVNNYHNEDGFVYLTSKDLNRLARDVMNVISAEEAVSSSYISTEQENEIIKDLIGVISEHKIHSQALTKEEWNSVFWNDIFSRPDVQTEYFNDVLTYNKNENNFKFNATKDAEFHQRTENRFNKSSEKKKSRGFGIIFDGFGLNASESKEGKNHQNTENVNDKETKDRNTLSFEDFQNIIQKKHVNVKWTGTKFEPKPFNLFRVNIRTLTASSEVYYKRIVLTKLPSTQKIEIRPETPLNSESDKTMSFLHYEALMTKINQNQEQINGEIHKRYETLHNIVERNLSEIVNKINSQITDVVNKAGTLRTEHNQLQNNFNDLNGFSRGIINNLLPAINGLQQFKNGWINHLQNMLDMSNVNRQRLDCLGEHVKFHDHPGMLKCESRMKWTGH